MRLQNPTQDCGAQESSMACLFIRCRGANLGTIGTLINNNFAVLLN
jgi:hypothetical protein